MSLNESAAAAIKKKVTLLDESFGRFAVRAILAGVYLAIGTAFAAVLGQAVEKHAEGLGAPVFALFFGLGLFAIVILGAELATGSMMYVVYGAINKQVGWGQGPVVAHRDHVLQPRRCGSLRSGNGHVCEAGPYRPDPPHFHLVHGQAGEGPCRPVG